MLNTSDVLETINMIREENLDIRTITMGISLLDCVSDDENRLCDKIYDKITKTAQNLVSTGEDIEKQYGIPIVNKRISVTPIALIGSAACKCPEDFVTMYFAPMAFICAVLISSENGPCAAMMCADAIPADAQASSDDTVGRTLAQTRDISRPMYTASSFDPVVRKIFPSLSARYSRAASTVGT